RGSVSLALFPYATLFRSFPPAPLLQCGGRARCHDQIGHRAQSSWLGDDASVATAAGVLQDFLYRGHREAPRADDVRNPQCDMLRSEEHTSELQSRENLVC